MYILKTATKRQIILGRKLGKVIEASANYLRQGTNEWLDLTRNQIIHDLEKKYVKDAASDLVLKLTEWGEIESSGEKIYKPLILNIIGRGANASLGIMEIREDFDLVNSRSVALAEDICSKLVREVTDETQKAISTAIRDRLAEGMGPREMAKDIRPLVGLTEKQIMAVANREEWLLVNRPELGPKEIQRRVTVYENRLHRRRATTIARTESARAVSEGSLQGYAAADLQEVEFNAAFEACPICQGLHGKRYKLSEASGMIPQHPNCYSRNTEIYTKDGWKLFKDVEVGETVLTMAPASKLNQWGRVINKVSAYADTIFHITNERNTIDMAVTGNHPFLVYDIIEPRFVNGIDKLSCYYSMFILPEFTGNIYKDFGRHEGLYDIKIEPEYYNAMVYDVEVEPNHTILTRRNGKVVWGSNCRCCWIPVVY